MAHVLVVPCLGQGHMNPMVQFAKTLASRGVLTTFVTTRFIARTAGVDAWPATVATISDGHDEGGLASASSISEYLEKQRAAASASLAAVNNLHGCNYESHTNWWLWVQLRDYTTSGRGRSIRTQQARGLRGSTARDCRPRGEEAWGRR